MTAVIDGTGKLRINGIFSFNIAFQCKRYQGIVSAGDISDFRGSLTTNIEKGVFITTGSFSNSAIEEASSPGKQQIDLIDGEEFITKLAEFGIGVKEVKNYEVNEDFFQSFEVQRQAISYLFRGSPQKVYLHNSNFAHK